MTTQQLAQQYFEAWTSKQYGRVREMMADDLSWESPLFKWTRADDVMPGFKRFADSAKSVKLEKLAVSGDDAALLYECDLPTGKVKMTSWLSFSAGKIRAMTVTFDASAMKAAQKS